MEFDPTTARLARDGLLEHTQARVIALYRKAAKHGRNPESDIFMVLDFADRGAQHVARALAHSTAEATGEPYLEPPASGYCVLFQPSQVAPWFIKTFEIPPSGAQLIAAQYPGRFRVLVLAYDGWTIPHLPVPPTSATPIQRRSPRGNGPRRVPRTLH